MKIKGPMAEKHLAVARRLESLRREFHISRQELADLSTLGVGLITRVELGRMRLRYADGKRWLDGLAKAIGASEWHVLTPINPIWLLDGAGAWELRWPLVLPSFVSLGASPNLLLVDFLQQHKALLADLAKDPPEGQLPQSWLQCYSEHWQRINGHIDHCHEGLQKVGSLLEALKPNILAVLKNDYNLVKFLRKPSTFAAMKAETVDYLKPLNLPTAAPSTNYAKAENKGLTDDTPERNNEAVVSMNELKKFQERLRRATKQRGCKAALARDLQVPPARISEWLSGAVEPSGETTLRLLRWVEKQERGQSKP